MSYHVAVLRTAGKRKLPIMKEEVAHAVAQVGEMRLVHDPEGKSVVEIIRNGEAIAALALDRGELWAKNPDRETLQSMLSLADILQARVRGDEFETYRTPDEVYEHPDDRAEKQQAQQAGRDLARRARLNQWVLNVCIFGFFLLLALIVAHCDKH